MKIKVSQITFFCNFSENVKSIKNTICNNFWSPFVYICLFVFVDCIDLRLEMSQTRMDLSSLLETMTSILGWNKTEETLFLCPLNVSTSHAFVSFILHNLITRSSAPLTTKGKVGWKLAQFTPPVKIKILFSKKKNM